MGEMNVSTSILKDHGYRKTNTVHLNYFVSYRPNLTCVFVFEFFVPTLRGI